MYLAMRTFAEQTEANKDMEIALVGLTDGYLDFIRNCLEGAKSLDPLPAEVCWHSDNCRWFPWSADEDLFAKLHSDVDGFQFLEEVDLGEETRTEGGRLVIIPSFGEVYWTGRYKHDDYTIETVGVRLERLFRGTAVQT